MVVSNNTIPSINIPFVDARGRITPIWHEFLRSFVAATVDGTINPDDNGTNIVAGNGLVALEEDDTTTLRVGQGSGLAVNADDVSVNITGQTSAQPTLDDEMLFSDYSDNNAIRKTTLRTMGGLIGAAPGGSTSQVQYNSSGFFGGDTGMTTNGAGSVNIQGDLTVDTVNMNAGTFSTALSSDVFTWTVPAGSASPYYVFTQSGTASSGLSFDIKCLKASTTLDLINDSASSSNTLSESVIAFKNVSTTKWSMGLTSSDNDYGFVLATTGLNTNKVFTVAGTGRSFTHNTEMRQFTVAAITASTTQTQGQGALTGDINAVATCANANDVVTLPGAAAGKSCLVINNGAQTLQVFPASGDDLGAGVNTSTTIVSTSRKWFVAYDSTNWEPVL